MDMNTLLDDVMEAVAQDSATDDWCKANYGQAIQVYGNFDEREPPAEADCPAVAIYPSRKDYGGQVYDDGLEFVAIIHDETSVSHAGISNITHYTGVKNIEALRKLILSAIHAVVAATDTSAIRRVGVDYEPIEFFPFVLVACAISVETPYTIGSGSPFVAE